MILASKGTCAHVMHPRSGVPDQLAPCIRRVFHGNNKVHRANKALKQLGFAFLSYLEQGARSFQIFLQLRQIFCR